MVVLKKKVLIIYMTVILLSLVFLAVKMFFLNGNDSVPETNKTEEKNSPYGEFLKWEEVDRLFPRYSYATVTDVETGLQFRVQRRAGKYHADVQPLTANDAYIMKNIYSGRWSWKRKAIILQLDNNRRIAASMNGMPHGGGTISGNKFKGHFCIHFRNSKTHSTRKINMDHQIMVWKAAGKVDEQLLSLSAKDIPEVFFAAVNQQEENIAEKMIITDSQYTSIIMKGIAGIESLRIVNIDYNMESNNFDVDLRVVYKGSDEQYKKLLLVNITGGNPQWKIDPYSLLPLLDIETD